MNGIICIKFSLDQGFLAGLLSGLGNSTIVGFYAWLVISSAIVGELFLSKHQLIFHIFSGGIFLLMEWMLAHREENITPNVFYLILPSYLGKDKFCRYLSLSYLLKQLSKIT